MVTIAVAGVTRHRACDPRLRRKPFEKQPLAFVPRIASPGDRRVARAMRLGRGGYGVAAPKGLQGCGDSPSQGEQGRLTREGPSAKRHLRRRSMDTRVAPQPRIRTNGVVKDHLGLVPITDAERIGGDKLEGGERNSGRSMSSPKMQ